MLTRLRFQLTILYLLAATGLVALMAVCAYLLLQNYLQTAADQALQYKMALQFEQYRLPLPPELASAEQNWLKENPHPTSAAALVSTASPTSTPLPSQTPPPALGVVSTPAKATASLPTGTPTIAATPTAVATATAAAPVAGSSSGKSGSEHSSKGEGESEGENKGDSGGESGASQSSQYSYPIQTQVQPTATYPSLAGSLSSANQHEDSEDALDARLAPIFVAPLNNSGSIDTNIYTSNPNPQPQPPVLLDSQAAAAALASGVDWRTVTLENGSRLRLLTYRTSSANGPALLQAGRLLDDQDLLLSRFLTGLLVISIFSVILLGGGSWWLSGRSLGPAQKAWDQQQAFVSNASHELRTPLTLMQATAEVALRDQPALEQRAYLEDIRREIGYMNHLVDDLLLLARLDARRLHLSQEAVPLDNLFSEIREQLKTLAREKGVRIVTEPSSGSLSGDPARLRQVLLIVLDNALRFTPPGGEICLEASRAGRMFDLVIRDTGSGIPAGDLPHVFERFYQSHSPTTNTDQENPRTSGLGLPIAKSLVEAMGGKIWIESQEGVGTKVFIRLPAVEHDTP